MELSMKRKAGILLIAAVMLFSCQSPVERWLDHLAAFKETTSKTLSVQAMKMNAAPNDTNSFSYQVRIYPAKAWLEDNAQSQNINFFYHMDSCFSLKAGAKGFPPAIVQPVSNGISGCYEYLLSFNLEPSIKGRKIELVYQDKFIDGRKYSLQLNGN